MQLFRGRIVLEQLEAELEEMYQRLQVLEAVEIAVPDMLDPSLDVAKHAAKEAKKLAAARVEKTELEASIEVKEALCAALRKQIREHQAEEDRKVFEAESNRLLKLIEDNGSEVNGILEKLILALQKHKALAKELLTHTWQVDKFGAKTARVIDCGSDYQFLDLPIVVQVTGLKPFSFPYLTKVGSAYRFEKDHPVLRLL